MVSSLEILLEPCFPNASCQNMSPGGDPDPRVHLKFRKKIVYGHEIDFEILPGARRDQKSNVHNHILSGKKS